MKKFLYPITCVFLIFLGLATMMWLDEQDGYSLIALITDVIGAAIMMLGAYFGRKMISG